MLFILFSFCIFLSLPLECFNFYVFMFVFCFFFCFVLFCFLALFNVYHLRSSLAYIIRLKIFLHKYINKNSISSIQKYIMYAYER